MLTTKTILTKTAEKYNLPYTTVEANYKAWVKGLKDRLLKDPILYLRLAEGLPLFFTNKIDRAEHGTRHLSKELVHSKKIKNKEIDKIIKKFEKYNSKYRSKKDIIYNNVPPIDFYGYNKGYSLKELEGIQNRMFEKMNKHEYNKNSET